MKSIVRFVVVLGVLFGIYFLSPMESRVTVASNSDKDLKGLTRSFGSLGLNSFAKSWVEKDFESDLMAAFRGNNPCGALSLLKESEQVSPAIYFSVGMKTMLRFLREEDPLLQSSFAQPNSPLYGSTEAAETKRDLPLEFLEALLLAGSLDWPEEKLNSKRSLEASLEVLEKLKESDPENGAIFYFIGQVKRFLGRAKDEIREAYTLSSKAPKFNPYYQDLYDRLMALSFKNEATFSFVYRFLENAPSPNYGEGLRYIRYWAQEEEAGKWVANRISKKFMDLGSEYKNKSPGYLYQQKEYVEGLNLKLTVEGRPEKDWEGYVTRMKEGKEFMVDWPTQARMAQAGLLQSLLNKDNNGCDGQVWKELYLAYKNKTQKN